jgi:hypothetical protein
VAKPFPNAFWGLCSASARNRGNFQQEILDPKMYSEKAVNENSPDFRQGYFRF